MARRARSLPEFGLNLRDWFHELARLTTRPQLSAAVRARPERLTGRFEGGEVADAFLAAQAEWICRRIGVAPPRWTCDRRYVLDHPWFSVPGRRVRTHLLLDTPDEFRNRNVFTTPELKLKIRPGRPRIPDDVKRQ